MRDPDRRDLERAAEIAKVVASPLLEEDVAMFAAVKNAAADALSRTRDEALAEGRRLERERCARYVEGCLPASGMPRDYLPAIAAALRQPTPDTGENPDAE